MNLIEKTSALAAEASLWISSNIVDVLIATAIGIVIAVVLMTLRRVGHHLVAEPRDGINWRTLVGRVLSKTTFFFIIMCAAELVAEHAETPPTLLRAINILFVIAAALQSAIWARELILGLIQHKVGDEVGAQTTLGSAIGIIRLLVTVALFAIALILILDNLGVNVTGLVAGLGIGGIAIGLAAQGIFSDLFAALAIIFDRPFRRGDTIKFDLTTGTVEEIGLKTTRLRSLDGEQVVISNTNLLNKQIQNFAGQDDRRFILRFGITYQTPPALLESVSEIVKTIVSRHDHARLVRCGMVGFSPSSLDHEMEMRMATSDFDLAFAARAKICIEMLAAFREAGIQFAYPTQISFTAAPDGSLIMPYPQVAMLAAKDAER
jgi:small-conductance mechanosensitive channel